MNFSLLFLDLGLVQYPHGIVKEQEFIKALSKIYKPFLDNDKKEANFSKAEIKLLVRLYQQLLEITELRQLKIPITARY